MNGLEKTQLQIERGTRTIVESVDQLRLVYGFDKVVVLTPIVETRLRSGLMAARPLKVAYQTAHAQIQVLLSVEMSYPNTAVEVTVTFGSVAEEMSVNESEYNTSLQEICQNKDADGKYINAKVVLDHVMQKLRGEFASLLEGGTETTAPSSAASLLQHVEDDDRTIGNEPVIFYACRRCRYCLFDSTAFQEHSKLGHNALKCSSLFLEEPPGNLGIKDIEQEGKLNCPKCETRVGQWSWIGSKCSCGEWITPAYQYTRSKLDERKE